MQIIPEELQQTKRFHKTLPIAPSPKVAQRSPMVITGFSRPVHVLQINGRCRSNHGLSVGCARAQVVSKHPCLPAAVCLARWARRSRCPNSARFVDQTSRYISRTALAVPICKQVLRKPEIFCRRPRRLKALSRRSAAQPQSII
jgi:hypothetical protein